ncbi:MAG TPA: 6-hydroxymethylpterin diphosphokinase MptE-like protein, partial [Spirochaetia bacterium]|nr:6-hydroxymethylpterin diphosphokinase MptE-like protein [Spirochaetia bacterium]
MAETARLEKNLLLLQARDPGLAAAVRQAPPDPRFVFVSARNGMSVPALRSPAGSHPLHSLYDPRQEASRLAESCSGAGCSVVFGLGAGLHVDSMLAEPSLQSLVVVEKDAGVLRSLMEGADFSRIFADPRVRIVCGFGELPGAIAAAWRPALVGALKTASLRAWCDREPEFFRGATAALQEAVDSVRADYGVQSHFGKRWFANMIRNLPLLRPAPARPSISAAAVTGAGPSLDVQAGRLASARAGSFLLATDTSLPALLQRGIVPDAVLSIDCQIY